MTNFDNPIERIVKTVLYKGVEFEVAERLHVLWVGCLDYSGNNNDESDIAATLERYRGALAKVEKRELMNPDWSAAISINYKRTDKPCGLMFAQETYSDQQDERYEIFTQPAGLWLRIKNDKKASALLNKERAETYEYFAQDVLQKAAQENGYMQNPDINIEIEYHCHADNNISKGINYAYIPIISL